MFRIFFAILLAALATPQIDRASPTFSGAMTNGTVDISGLREASGIAASRNNPGVIWTENDSGNPALVYAMNAQGQSLGTYTLPGNTDNEDIGIGPGPVTNVSYLYVADIGDNNSTRSNIAIYQIPEPAVYLKQASHPVIARAMKGGRTITLMYPDGPHDAEAEFTDPVTGDWYVLTKASISRVYTAPKALLDATNSITLSFVRSLAFNVPSGADISPLGDEIIVRQEDFARLWSRAQGQPVSSAFNNVPTTIPVVGTANGEPNGEAIGFDDYGGGYFTLSDSETIQPLFYFARTSFDGPTRPVTLVPMASTWKYLDNDSDQGTAWQGPIFDDASWSSGPAQLGYGDGDEETVVNFGPDPDNKYITTYFRKTFIATNVSEIAALTLKLVVDDGANVFLNGSAVANVNLEPGAAYNTPAAAMPTALRDTWQSYAIDPQLLVEGTNTICAEVHLASVASNSLSFDLQLIAIEVPVITSIAWITNQAILNLAGASNSPTSILATTDFASWTNLGSVLLTNGNGVFSDPAVSDFQTRFYRAMRAIP